jgi:tetratricopeptide (TPR) repeat protein
MAHRVGQQLDNYRLIRLLGAGTFGEVYLGEHLSHGTLVAVKMFKVNLTPGTMKKFLNEARTFRLKHLHIVQLLDFGVVDDTPFLVMDYAAGGNLRERHPQGTPVLPELVLSYVKQIASALQYAHEMRLIHRDVKPQNMLLGRNDEVLLSDFGSAVFTPIDRSPSAKGMAGTAAYMAPEQLRGKAQLASDQYALGIVIYEWLCGMRPFQGSLWTIIDQQLSVSPPSLRERMPMIPAGVEEVVLKALAKEPQERFASVQDFATAFEQASLPTVPLEAPAVLGQSLSSIPTEILALSHEVGAQAEIPLPETAQSEQQAVPSTDEGGEADVFIWNMPYARNPFFTGRENLLIGLDEHFSTEHVAALTQPYALSGLGGIGKTQLAVEYAYRYRERYRAIFWVRAASRDTLVADYVVIADLLHLPEKNEQDQNAIVAAVRYWLTRHAGWLLILDNADDLPLVVDFLPVGSGGHILLTTRAQATGKIAKSVSIEKLDQDEGMLLLLRRAKQLAPDAPLDALPLPMLSKAQVIVLALDGLPLALDQAGAYIEETDCGLAAYLELYQKRRKDLLKRRSMVSLEYPHTVASTWSLSFQQVEAANPAAAELLRLCAFLDPDVIPEAIITEGASVLGPVLGPVATDPLQLNEAIQALRRFSLVKRDADEKILNLHRLVQVALKDGMDAQAQRQWAERTVRAISAVFHKVTFANWPRCELCLPHAQACAELIDQHHFTFPAAARLLMHTGWYLRERGQYTQAEPLLQRALAIREQVLGFNHADTASTLHHLARLYYLQAHYAQAEPLFQRALTIREQVLGPDHPDTAAALDHLAYLYQYQDKYGLAEHLFQRALAINERLRGPGHPDTATVLNDLGWLYYNQGKYEQSERCFERALMIREHALGPDHPDTADTLRNVAYLYHLRGRYAQAEPLFRRALAICEHALGPDHPTSAAILGDMGQSYLNQGRYAEAEPLLQRALTIDERVFGREHAETAVIINHLARCSREQGQYAQAELLFQQALAIREKVLGPSSPVTAITYSDLATLYRDQGQYVRAEPLFQRALAIYEQALLSDHPRTVTTLENYAILLRKMQRLEEAVQLEARVAATRAKLHP